MGSSAEVGDSHFKDNGCDAASGGKNGTTHTGGRVCFGLSGGALGVWPRCGVACVGRTVRPSAMRNVKTGRQRCSSCCIGCDAHRRKPAKQKIDRRSGDGNQDDSDPARL
eukprot:4187190-Pleurochrysis_carterae.AAC.3